MEGVVIPALERRYHLSSSQASLIPVTFEIASLIGVIPFSYYGDRAHKPRWLGFGSLLLGIGALVFAMPQVCCWVVLNKYALSLQSIHCTINVHAQYVLK